MIGTLLGVAFKCSAIWSQRPATGDLIIIKSTLITRESSYRIFYTLTFFFFSEDVAGSLISEHPIPRFDMLIGTRKVLVEG